ncbi:MAG: hypothetical protein ABMA00_11815 [Gemmatimonas sp.]
MPFRTHTSPILLVALLVTVPLSGCGGGGSTNPGTPPGGGGLPQNANVHLEIRGLTGSEGAMEVRYAIANAAVTRAAESVIPRAALLQYCTTVGSTGSCDITVPVGQFVSLYAYEGFDGVYTPTTVIIPMNKYWHEFVTFSGDCGQSGGLLHGDCGVNVTQAKTYNVRADFTAMPEVRVMQHGMTGYRISPITVRTLLQMPAAGRTVPQGASGGPFPALALGSQVWFPFGTEVNLVAQQVNQSRFIRWEGCKTGTGGTDPSCTLPQATSGGAPAVVRLFHEYYQCANGSIADAPSANCTLVRP